MFLPLLICGQRDSRGLERYSFIIPLAWLRQGRYWLSLAGKPISALSNRGAQQVGQNPPSRCKPFHKVAAAWLGSPWPFPQGAQTAPARPALQAPARPSGHCPSRSCPKLCDAPKPWPPEPQRPQILLFLFHAQNTLWECQGRASDIPLNRKRKKIG